jgi:hypothetical protein
MILGVFGISYPHSNVAANIADPKKAKTGIIDSSESVGALMMPEFSRPLREICEPSPTSNPETIRRRVDILYIYI